MRRPAALLLLCLVAGCRPPAPGAARAEPVPVRFADVTGSAGIRFLHRHGGAGQRYFPETMGSGTCFFDYDNDGHPDLYVVQEGTLPNRPGFGGKGNRSALYRNLGDGRFADVTDRAGVGNFRYGMGACAADYDADGRLDLYVTNFGPNRLYRNNGDGTFTDVAPKAGVVSSGFHSSAAFADIDADGDLDLYVARYVKYQLGADPLCGPPGLRSYCPPNRFPGETDVLYRNNGDGTFTDITAEAGVTDPDGRGLGVLFFDYNDDGRPDLFVANDTSLNRLYENLGGGRFRDVTMAAGVGLNDDARITGAMGVDAADYDFDGRLDLFIANFSQEPNDLYRNRGDGTFAWSSGEARLATPGLLLSGFGAAFVDYDLDGLPDLVVANGHVDDHIARSSPGVTFAEKRSLYRNLGDGTFQDAGAAVGPDFQREAVGRGLALADYDDDGDPDLFVSNNNERPELLRNEGGNASGWLKLRLKGRGKNPFAVGAKVTVEAGGRKQVQEVRCGSSYASSHDLTLIFGLGGARQADRVTVRWPNGGTRQWSGLAAGRLHTLAAEGP